MIKKTFIARFIIVTIAAGLGASAVGAAGRGSVDMAPVVKTVEPGAPEDTTRALAATGSSMGGRQHFATVEAYRAELFRRHVRAFAADLSMTGRMSDKRARALATISVTEAMRAGVPPALVLGVMRIENSEFDSRARSSVGARGLMQVMPATWLPVFGSFFGWDLGNDTTNVRMGVRILSQNMNEAGGDWRKGLLRYNGCVRGSNTPDCFVYPEKVKRAVERDARWSCGGREFDDCVVNPLIALGETRRHIE